MTGEENLYSVRLKYRHSIQQHPQSIFLCPSLNFTRYELAQGPKTLRPISIKLEVADSFQACSVCIVDYFNTISTTRCLDLREASQNGKWSRNEAKKAILAGCKYYLQVMINLYPSGCPNKSCYSIIHGLFGYLSSFNSRC